MKFRTLIPIYIFTGRNEVVAKVMFLQLCVILFTGGVSGRENPPGRRTPWKENPPEEKPPLPIEEPPGRRTPPLGGRPPRKENPLEGDPREREPPRHTVNERSVRILLECILVIWMQPMSNQKFL